MYVCMYMYIYIYVYIFFFSCPVKRQRWWPYMMVMTGLYLILVLQKKNKCLQHSLVLCNVKLIFLKHVSMVYAVRPVPQYALSAVVYS